MRDLGTLARKVNSHNTDVNKPLQEVKFLIEDPDNPRNVLTYVFTFSDDDRGEDVSDEGDEEEEDDESLDEGENDDNVEVITLTPQQLFPEYFEKLSKRKKGAKRGRPRKGESANQPPAAAAKRLRKEFGFTQPQLQIVAKDIVDDNLVSKEKAYEDEYAVEIDVGGDSGSSEQLAISRTRSGRVSRPPAAIDEDMSAKIKPKARDSEGPQVERVKRKLTIPDRYRCAVCHKIYLGDRKMKKHVKLFPNHGPSPESLYPSLAPQGHSTVGSGPLAPPPPPPPSMMVSGKKMPPSSAEFPLPIMTMARTQLEELVKNLDAELVLDVVSKKMFDNFSLWQLESKKLSSMAPGIKASATASRF